MERGTPALWLSSAAVGSADLSSAEYARISGALMPSRTSALRVLSVNITVDGVFTGIYKGGSRLPHFPLC